NHAKVRKDTAMADFSWRFLVWFSVLLMVMVLSAIIAVCMVVRVHAADHCACTNVSSSLKG
ncbi:MULTISPECIES: hypothetical protein, partial [unclassified Mesorhizobium]|uniref:hypothetical protein n=2 Tax=unclassified Mesorhizobium TaxID=325217 RepID=UPI001AEF3313